MTTCREEDKRLGGCVSLLLLHFAPLRCTNEQPCTRLPTDGRRMVEWTSSGRASGRATTHAERTATIARAGTRATRANRERVGPVPHTQTRPMSARADNRTGERGWRVDRSQHIRRPRRRRASAQHADTAGECTCRQAHRRESGQVSGRANGRAGKREDELADWRESVEETGERGERLQVGERGPWAGPRCVQHTPTASVQGNCSARRHSQRVNGRQRVLSRHERGGDGHRSPPTRPAPVTRGELTSVYAGRGFAMRPTNCCLHHQ
ncbi:uncharacterized protein B0H18DRAFT_326048 [Fomitopsis serialis]|uniref:uncharacterized protein n=1 Tax=Fomitopsis serialis TaxID=139415 RepID=UPI002008D330|nr:uncharacterized protein B0H18DRAFT_326048 [Neoantrodia serialis]KAH9936545.1 hypothetical protein B0H18DRAFT_326048 [Neoantrodia serialis]